MRINDSKTDAGVRQVDLLSVLRDELATDKASARHADPKMTLSIYAQVMFRGEGERERLQSVVSPIEWAQMGTNADFGLLELPEDLADDVEKRRISGEDDDGRGRFRTSNLSRVKRGRGEHWRREAAGREQVRLRPGPIPSPRVVAGCR